MRERGLRFFLNQREVSERSIGHKLAVALDSEVLGFDVDDEFDRNIDKVQAIAFACCSKGQSSFHEPQIAGVAIQGNESPTFRGYKGNVRFL